MTFLIGAPNVVLGRELVDSASDAHLGTNFSFTNLNFGTAYADRYLVAVMASSSDNREVTDVTIGGITASNIVSDSSGVRRASIWGAVVPTGTTGDVEATVSGTAAGCGLHLYSLYPFTPENTGNLLVSGDGLVVPDSGWAIGCGMEYKSGSPTITLTGITEDATISWTVAGLSCRLTAGSIAGDGTSQTISVSGSTGGPYGFAVSAFGPP